MSIIPMNSAAAAPSFDWIDVTPHMATRWLEANTNNRTISDAHVRNLARAMNSSAWEMNGDPVRFSASGVLLDGQHRLSAIVKSGTTQRMLVIYGLGDVMHTIDRNRARTAADHLVIKFKVQNSATVAGGLRALRAFITLGEVLNGGDYGAGPFEPYDAERWFQKHPEIVDSATSLAAA